jgi:RNA methyltransferase, TrmH family
MTPAMITSNKNPKIQLIRSLLGTPRSRREAQAFVVEGVRLAEEALASGWPAQLVLYGESVSARGQEVISGFQERGVEVEAASDSVLQSASDTQNPQGILVVLAIQSLPLPEKLNFVFIPDGVRDPGNLGTMLRTAAAAGADAVFLPEGTTDAFAPKVVRSAMGAHFRLPVVIASWDEIEKLIRASNLRVYLASAGDALPYEQADLRVPLAIIIGGEAEGAGEAAASLANAALHIPMPGQMESLNAATAAAIFLFEVVRQRRTASQRLT